MATASELKSAFLKLASYCAYQERSLKEVRDKLAQYQFSLEEEERIISSLEEENFLNQARFAHTYAQSKFRQQKWGRYKISHSLKQKGVEAGLIAEALRSIDEEAYWDTLMSLAQKKWGQLKESLPPFQKKQKTLYFLSQKGFETGLAQEAIQACIEA